MTTHWSPQLHVALGLADAMLAGIADRRLATARCADALGQHPPWLDRLVHETLLRFAARWRADERHRLADFLARHPLSLDTWARSPPLIRHWHFNPATMTAPSLGIQPLALPELPSVGDLAHWLGLPLRQLQWLADPQQRNPRSRSPRLRHYLLRQLPKRHGGWRLLEAPKDALRRAQRQVLHGLLDYVPAHEAAQGFRRGRSALTHAAAHSGRRLVLRFDLEDFFLSISGARVRAVFARLGFPDSVARHLAGLCATATAVDDFDAAVPPASDSAGIAARWQLRQRYRTPHLPQGAPTSPALANLCAFGLDLRLSAAADRFGARYTRYADDLVFSGDDMLARSHRALTDLVMRVVAEEGFRLNHRKTRVMRQSVRQQVGGVVVNRRPNVAREEFDRLKAILTNCVRHGWRSQNRDRHPDFRAHLTGRVAQAASINPQRGARLRALLGAIDWQAR